MEIDKSMLDEYAQESLEHLGNIEEDVLTLSKEKKTSLRHELIDKIFRSIHSVKGAAGFLSLTQIEKLTHTMENLLSGLRTANIRMKRDVIDSMLSGVDLLIYMLNNVDKSNETDISKVCIDINRHIKPQPGSTVSGSAGTAPGIIKTEVPVDKKGEIEIGFEINPMVLDNIPLDYNYLYLLKYDLDKLQREDGISPVALANELLSFGEILDARLHVSSPDLFKGIPKGPVDYLVLYASFMAPDVISVTLGLAGDRLVILDRDKILKSAEPVHTLLPADSMEESLPVEQDNPEGFIKSGQNDIRVELDKLDVLINLVGELVISESMVTNNQDLAGLELENFEYASRNHRRIISELQDAVMTMRMIPLANTFRKMNRLVHDLTNRLGKDCRLELSGEDTELDKTVVEQITDPLLHIIRNCLDHGIESRKQRLEKGKQETGTIKISAAHQGGEVLIRIADDGRGLDTKKLIASALEKNIVNNDDRELSESEIHKLIFKPGFSTAEKITDVSGRGVGLDVVQQNIEKLKGRVEVQSVKDRGTVFLLRIPLTVAIIEGMLVSVGIASYTIPLLSIQESFKPHPDQVTLTMEGQEIIRIRDELVPVLRLHEFYGVNPGKNELAEGILVHVASGRKSICLFADEIIGHHQTVIKSMPAYVSSARGVSGCTILSSGEVSLILDIGSIIELSENNKN